MPGCLQSEADIGAGDDDCLAREVILGIWQPSELIAKEGVDEVATSGLEATHSLFLGLGGEGGGEMEGGLVSEVLSAVSSTRNYSQIKGHDERQDPAERTGTPSRNFGGVHEDVGKASGEGWIRVCRRESKQVVATGGKCEALRETSLLPRWTELLKPYFEVCGHRQTLKHCRSYTCQPASACAGAQWDRQRSGSFVYPNLF